MNLNEDISRLKELMGIHESKRKRFDFRKLVDNGILWVTQPYVNGKKDSPNWEYDSNIVTLWNLKYPEPGQEWVFDAINHPKHDSIDYWTEKGQDTLEDDKYYQILRSIDLKKMK